MNKVTATIRKLDRFQQRHRIVGFLYAVTKKYSDDEAGYQAALVTYYVFLSLFPLLLALTSLLQLVLSGEPHFKAHLIDSVTNTFPVLGDQLRRNIHELGKTGFALAISILFTIYGARGAADALQKALNHIWQVPRTQRAGFPNNIMKNLGIILTAGSGLLLTSALSSYAAGLHGLLLKVVFFLLIVAMVFGTLLLVFRVAISGRYGLSNIWIGALIAAIGIEVLQVVGVYLVAHELRRLDSLYGAFAIVLGLLFWIYLQAQIIMYAVEIDTVRHFRLWPRSINQPLTAEDERAYDLYAAKEIYHTNEKIHVHFEDLRNKFTKKPL